FPVLTSAQQARVLAHGRGRTVEHNEIVVELNEHVTKFFVVVSGQLHILQVSNNQEQVVAICNAGMFTGELNVLSGRRGLVRIRAAEKSELIEIEREVAHLFSMTGAVPNSAWFGGYVACDQAGFIKTGLDLTTEDLAKAMAS